MSAQHQINNPNRFFGINLGSIWDELVMAWKGLAAWPIFSWLWPTPAIRLWLPSGQQAVVTNLHTFPLKNDSTAKSARFEAIVLPESLLLRRTIAHPNLQPSEALAALTLEIQSMSPFPPTDTVWGYETDPLATGVTSTQLVLSSRRLILQHVDETHPSLQLHTFEVWTARAHGTGFLVLPGFGEAPRYSNGMVWRWVSAFLALLAILLIIAIVVTPTIKLYLQVLQANQAMSELHNKVSPVLAQRDLLTRTTEQLASLTTLTGKPIPPLEMLTVITEALPDNTSLLSLQIQGLKVSLSGQTTDTATLMKQLGSTPGLRDVKAPTPATKPLGASRESFSIDFILDPNLLKPAP